MGWLLYDCKNITKKKPYFWIAEAKRDVKREKRNKKRRDSVLDFRSVLITLTTVGIVILFQSIHKEVKEFKLSNLRHAYEDFEETENRAVAIAVILRFDVGNFALEEKYNSNDTGIDSLFITGLLFALDTKNPEKAKATLNQYDETIYGKMSSFEVINKRLMEKNSNIIKAAKNIDNKDSLAIAYSTMFIHSTLESHRSKLQGILNLQREILKIIEKDETNKRGSELSMLKEKINEYFVDLDWQTEKIVDAHNKINESFSNLEI